MQATESPGLTQNGLSAGRRVNQPGAETKKTEPVICSEVGAVPTRCERYEEVLTHMSLEESKKGMRRAMVFMALALSFISCARQPYGTVTHRGRNGHPDQWVYWIDKDTWQISIDTSGAGRPDIVKTYKANDLVRIEKDRNFDGKVDLVQEYSHGVLVREIHDDDFDGKPESTKIFRPDGTVAIVERDPHERGAIDIREFYDKSGRLTRREVRGD